MVRIVLNYSIFLYNSPKLEPDISIYSICILYYKIDRQLHKVAVYTNKPGAPVIQILPDPSKRNKSSENGLSLLRKKRGHPLFPKNALFLFYKHRLLNRALN